MVLLPSLSGVESVINRLKDQIKDHREREAQFEIRVKHGDSLSTADENARKVNLEELEEDKEEMDEIHEKVFKVYEKFLGTKAPDFARIVQKHCFEEADDVAVEEILLRKCAYKTKNGKVSAKASDRLPEKDKEPNATAKFGFRWCTLGSPRR